MSKYSGSIEVSKVDIRVSRLGLRGFVATIAPEDVEGNTQSWNKEFPKASHQQVMSATYKLRGDMINKGLAADATTIRSEVTNPGQVSVEPISKTIH